MKSRAVDLSLEELAVMGAHAASSASCEARDAGLSVTGTVDFSENGQSVSVTGIIEPSAIAETEFRFRSAD